MQTRSPLLDLWRYILDPPLCRETVPQKGL